MSALVAGGLPVFPVGPTTGPIGPDGAARVVRRRRKSKQGAATSSEGAATSSEEATQYRVAKKYQVIII